MGVLNHGGKAPGAGVLLFSEDFCETGSNVTIEYLHQVIEHERARLNVLGLLLPPRLHVQFDDCSRENKNSYTHVYLEMLAVNDVFCEVQADYLPKGHTHEDVYQHFSRTDAAASKAKATTLTELHQVLEHSFTPKPIFKHFETTVNARRLMEGNGWVRPPSELRGFTVFPRFGFTTDSAGDSCCDLSLWHCDPKPEMLLLSGKPGGFLKAGVDLDLCQA
jgi:hypothetical protein